MSGTRQTPEFKKMRFSWFTDQIMPIPDREFPASGKLVLYCIGDNFNNRDSDGRAWIGYEAIADAIGMSEPTVVAMVHRAEALGHIRVEWGKQGRKNTNKYWMIVKNQPAEVSDEDKPQLAEVFDAMVDGNKPQLAEKKPQLADMNHSIEPWDTYGVPLREIPGSASEGVAQEGSPRRRRRTSRHGGGATTPVDATHGAAATHGRANGGATHVPHWADFTYLRDTIWDRGDPKDRGFPQRRQEDIAAWTVALTKASPEEIIASAKKWAAAKADQPHMLTQLAIWLNGESWKIEPPRKKTSKVNGAGPGKGKSRGSSRRKGDGAKSAFNLAAQLKEKELARKHGGMK